MTPVLSQVLWKQTLKWRFLCNLFTKEVLPGETGKDRESMIGKEKKPSKVQFPAKSQPLIPLRNLEFKRSQSVSQLQARRLWFHTVAPISHWPGVPGGRGGVISSQAFPALCVCDQSGSEGLVSEDSCRYGHHKQNPQIRGGFHRNVKRDPRGCG